jgi:hypothetical protein
VRTADNEWIPLTLMISQAIPRRGVTKHRQSFLRNLSVSILLVRFWSRERVNVIVCVLPVSSLVALNAAPLHGSCFKELLCTYLVIRDTILGHTIYDINLFRILSFKSILNLSIDLSDFDVNFVKIGLKNVCSTAHSPLSSSPPFA